MNSTTGTQITCTDLTTGQQESIVIKDDHVVIVDGNQYVSSRDWYPTTGTTVITIKTRKKA